MRAEEIARVCHEANRAIQTSLCEEVSPPWDGAPDWMRESAVKGVVGVQAGDTPEQSHEAWVKDRLERGWAWGLFKSELGKTHPDLVPYAELDEDQKLKDTVFHALVTILS